MRGLTWLLFSVGEIKIARNGACEVSDYVAILWSNIMSKFQWENSIVQFYCKGFFLTLLFV